MFGSMVVAVMEVSIITLEASTVIMMQMEKMLHGGNAIRNEVDLMRDKFVALQRAFADASLEVTHAAIGQDLRCLIKVNYDRIRQN
jgi:hypothetical protein